MLLRCAESWGGGLVFSEIKKWGGGILRGTKQLRRRNFYQNLLQIIFVASMTITTKCFSPPGTSTPGPSKPGMNAVEYTPIVEEPGSEISIMSGNDLKKT